MLLMIPYVLLAPPLILASSEWALTDFVLTSLFCSAHCTSLALCPGSFCSGGAHAALFTSSPRVQMSQHLWGKPQPVKFRS